MAYSKTSKKSLWFMGILCVALLAIIAMVLIGVMQNQSGLIKSSSFRKAMCTLFNKNASAITQADLESVQVLMIDDTNSVLYAGFEDLFKAIQKNASLEADKQEDYSKLIVEIPLSTPITSFEDYKLLKNVKYLSVTDCSTFTDLSQLDSFSDLIYLYLDDTSIDSIAPLTKYTNLEGLYISGTKVTDISPVAQMKNLKSLSIDKLAITDLSPVKDLKLNYLSAAECGLTDVSALEGMSSLKTLSLTGNKLTSIAPLKGMKDLGYLSVDKNKDLSDLSPLGDTTKLTTLLINGCNISDISAIKGNTKLEYLYAADNKITDISAFEKMNALFYVDISNNKITDGSPLKNKTSLLYLMVTGNEFKDWTVLDKLTNTSVVGRPSTTTKPATSSKPAASSAPASSKASA